MTPEELAGKYFDAWLSKDVDSLKNFCCEGVTFEGPLAQLEGKNDVLDGLRGLASATENIVFRKRLVDENNVMTWFVLDVEGAKGMQVVNWCECESGKISAIHVTFDPRPMFE